MGDQFSGYRKNLHRCPARCPLTIVSWSAEQEFSVEIWNAQGQCVLVNNGWRRLWQMPDHVLLGSDYSILADPGLHAKPVWQVLQHGFRGADSIGVETPPSYYDPEAEDKRSGRPRWTEGIVVPLWTGHDSLDELGPPFTAILLHDVTEAIVGRQTLRKCASSLQKTFSAAEELQKQNPHGMMMQGARGAISPETRIFSAPGPKEARLTREETRALSLLAKGYTVKEASTLLGKSEKTIYVQLASASEKTGLCSISQLTVYSCRWLSILA